MTRMKTTRVLAFGKSKGFTLIELLVVIAIIGILSSVVLASLNSARKKGRDARRVADVKQLQLALELYYDANPSVGYPIALGTGQTGALVTGGFISTIPTDPQNNVAYNYSAVALSGGVCTSYHLGTSLEVSTNSAKDTDADAAAGTACTGSAADFSGADTAACGQDPADAGVLCYDVKP